MLNQRPFLFSKAKTSVSLAIAVTDAKKGANTFLYEKELKITNTIAKRNDIHPNAIGGAPPG